MDSILILDWFCTPSSSRGGSGSSTPLPNRRERRLAHLLTRRRKTIPKAGIGRSFCPAAPTACGRPMRPLRLEGVRAKWPVLGVCFGAQWLAQNGGGRFRPATAGNTAGPIDPHRHQRSPVFRMTEGKAVWMSHGDNIQNAGSRTRITCSTEDVQFAGFAFEDEPTCSIQFHPEVYHSEEGLTLLRNFVHDICGCSADWTPAHFVDTTVAERKKSWGTIGLSSVSAAGSTPAWRPCCCTGHRRPAPLHLRRQRIAPEERIRGGARRP